MLYPQVSLEIKIIPSWFENRYLNATRYEYLSLLASSYCILYSFAELPPLQLGVIKDYKLNA